jgi:hypothetical protein
MSRSSKKSRTKSRPVERPQNAIKNITLEAARQKFEAGDYGAILLGMYLCTQYRIQPPDWLINAFCDRVRSPENFETWDDAFGPPMPPGTKKAGREEKKNWVPLALKIHKLRARGIRGQALYEQAAEELNLRLDWQTVRDAYYRKSKNIRDILEHVAFSLEVELREVFSSPEEYEAWLVNLFSSPRINMISDLVGPKPTGLHLRKNAPR